MNATENQSQVKKIVEETKTDAKKVSVLNLLRLPWWKRTMSLLTGILLVGFMVYWVGWQDIWENLSHVNFVYVLFGIVCIILSSMCSGLRWYLGLRFLFGLTSRLGTSFRFYLESSCLTYVVPGAQATGDIWRTVRLYRVESSQGGHWLECLCSTVWDRAIGLWSLFLISWLASLWPISLSEDIEISKQSEHLLRILQWVEAIVVLGFPLFIFLLPFLPDVLKRKRIFRIWIEVNNRIRQHKLATLSIVLLSLIVLMLTAISWVMALRGIFPHLPFSVGLASAASIYVAASLPVSFGGWGTRELAAVQVMAAYGLASAEVVAASVVLGGMFSMYALLISPIFFWKYATPTQTS